MTTEAERGAIQRVEERLHELVGIVGEVRERLARMEGAALHTTVDSLRVELASANARIAALEASHHQDVGSRTASKTWGEWVHRLSPWIFAVALVVWNYMRPPV